MLWICKVCTTKYSVGAKNCPQCESTEHHDEGVEPADSSPVEPSGTPADEGETEVVNLPEDPEVVPGNPPAAGSRRRAK